MITASGFVVFTSTVLFLNKDMLIKGLPVALQRSLKPGNAVRTRAGNITLGGTAEQKQVSSLVSRRS